MPRPKKKFPSLCRHKAKKLAYVTLNGKPKYLGAWPDSDGRPAPEVEAAYTRLIAELGNPLMGNPADRLGTIAELLDAFLTHLANRVKMGRRAESEKDHMRTVARVLLSRWASVEPNAFGPQTLEAVREQFIALGLARTTINEHTSRVRAIFKWGGSVQLIDSLIYQRLLCVGSLKFGEGGVETEERQPVLWPMVVAVRPHVSRQVWAMIQLQWYTGMRSQNIVEMSTGRIDMTGEVWFYTPITDKTRKRRKRRDKLVVALGPKAQEILRPWLRFTPEEFLFQPAEAETERRTQQRQNRKTPVWPSHAKRYIAQRKRTPRRAAGSCYTPKSYRRAIARACRLAYPPPAHLVKIKIDNVTETDKQWRLRLEAAGLLDELDEHRAAFWWTPHQIRHTFATRAGDEFDGKLDEVAAALGHKHIDTTKLYAHINKAKAARVAMRIG